MSKHRWTSTLTVNLPFHSSTENKHHFSMNLQPLTLILHWCKTLSTQQHLINLSPVSENNRLILLDLHHTGVTCINPLTNDLAL